MIKMISTRGIEALKQQYEGKRLELVAMPDDPDPIPSGTKGICEMVDGVGQLIMRWDNGRSLSLIPGVDKFVVIS